MDMFISGLEFTNHSERDTYPSHGTIYGNPEMTAIAQPPVADATLNLSSELRSRSCVNIAEISEDDQDLQVDNTLSYLPPLMNIQEIDISRCMSNHHLVGQQQMLSC